jgi:predicted RND superfamily exporter protein
MALLPIAISIASVAAFVSVTDVRLSIVHSVMLPLLLGINLDYGIFAVHAWHASRHDREQTSHFAASFAALIICGGSTIIGFGSLAFTSIPAVQSLGWLINVGVVTCVLGTLLVLWPAMLAAARGRIRS